MINEEKFNKWFGLFIMVGMSIAVCSVTAFKLGASQDGKALLLLSAFASLMGVVGTVTSAVGKVYTYFFSFFDVLIYGIVCIINWKHGGAGLGNGLLHLAYFVPMQFVGFFQWKKRETTGGTVRPRRLTAKQRWLSAGVVLLLSLVVYVILAKFDKSAADSFVKMAVVLDTIPVVCNIIGQFLMSTAYMEQWIFWIGVNIASIIMWTSSFRHTGDSFTLVYIIKYCFYFLNCCNGLRIWLRLSEAKCATDEK